MKQMYQSSYHVRVSQENAERGGCVFCNHPERFHLKTEVPET